MCAEREVAKLVRKTRKGHLAHDMRTKLYYNKASGRLYRPLVGHLASCFYPDHKYTKGKKPTLSNRHVGDAFHRAVFHANHGAHKCTCNEKYGSEPVVPETDRRVKAALAQRERFLEDNHLTPAGSEVIVPSDHLGMATAVDELAWKTSRSGRRRLWHISWKTGYTNGLVNTCRHLLGKNIKCSKLIKCCPFVHHQLQLWAEDMLLRENGVTPDVNVVVYVLHDSLEPDDYCCYYSKGVYWKHKETGQALKRQWKEYCRCLPVLYAA
jgi:hypothetical protein